MADQIHLKEISDQIEVLTKDNGETQCNVVTNSNRINDLESSVHKLQEQLKEKCDELERVNDRCWVLEHAVIKYAEKEELLEQKMIESEKDKMKCNVVIRNVNENKKEKVIETARETLAEMGHFEPSVVLGAYRIGKFTKGKNRPIVVMLYHEHVAQEILKRAKQRYEQGIQYPEIFPHRHSQDREERLRNKNIAKPFEGRSDCKIMYKNGGVYVNNSKQIDPVVPPTLKDILHMDEEQSQKCEMIDPLGPVKLIEKGSKFTMYMLPVHNYMDCMDAYYRVASIPEVMSATHLMSAYILRDGTCGSRDDRDWSMGTSMLGFMQRYKLTGVMCFLARHYGGTHLGTRRFEIIRELMNRLVDDIKRSGHNQSWFNYYAPFPNPDTPASNPMVQGTSKRALSNDSISPTVAPFSKQHIAEARTRDSRKNKQIVPTDLLQTNNLVRSGEKKKSFSANMQQKFLTAFDNAEDTTYQPAPQVMQRSQSHTTEEVFSNIATTKGQNQVSAPSIPVSVDPAQESPQKLSPMQVTSPTTQEEVGIPSKTNTLAQAKPVVVSNPFQPLSQLTQQDVEPEQTTP